MAKVLVMYHSNYGVTKKYAEWIASELNADIYSVNNINQSILVNYDTIILGGGLYAGSIKGINLLINHFENIKNKKLIIFTCGLADYSRIEHQNEINNRLKKKIPGEIFKIIKIFYFRGGINYKKLSFIHKIMMWLMKVVTEKKGIEKLNDEDKEFLLTYGKTLDFSDKSSIAELVEYCKQ